MLSVNLPHRKSIILLVLPTSNSTLENRVSQVSLRQSLQYSNKITTNFYYLYMTGSSSRCPLFSHSTVRNKHNSYFLVIKPQFKKYLFEVCVVCKKILPGIERRLNNVR